MNTDAISAILAPIYETLPKTTAAGQHNLTYGEIEWSSLKFMTDTVSKTTSRMSGQKGIFYDLGCGRGRAVLYMALTGLFEKSVGIEVLPERLTLAQGALNTLKASIPNAGSNIRLYESSFLNPAFKYKDAQVVFLSNLCFDDQTQTALFNKLNLEMPKGSLIFCLRSPSVIPSALVAVGRQDSAMTWNPNSEIYIFRHL
jgi:SAM-dependent methyltransferase